MPGSDLSAQGLGPRGDLTLPVLGRDCRGPRLPIGRAQGVPRGDRVSVIARTQSRRSNLVVWLTRRDCFVTLSGASQ